ncbi:MAG: IclR family transcriptional regulator [Novosphingobium sp.]
MRRDESHETKVSAAGQGIERVAAILRVLAKRSRFGSRLTDVADETGLNKSTVHRLLASLVAQKLVEVEERNGLFYLGFDMLSLSANAADRFGLVTLARESVNWLERRTGDTVFLSVRSGHESVCVDRASGAFPIKVLTLAVGDRRPLGVGAGSLALLSGLDDQEIEAAIGQNAPVLKHYGDYDADILRNMVDRTRSEGYAFNPGQIVTGMQAIGVAVPRPSGSPFVALSIAAITERMTEMRRLELLDDMRVAATQIGDRLAEIATLRIDA